MTVRITTAPLAPPCPSGRPGAYGLHTGHATAATGEQVTVRTISEATARYQARRAAQEAWGELLTFLDEETRFQEAMEAGDVDPRE